MTRSGLIILLLAVVSLEEDHDAHEDTTVDTNSPDELETATPKAVPSTSTTTSETTLAVTRQTLKHTKEVLPKTEDKIVR